MNYLTQQATICQSTNMSFKINTMIKGTILIVDSDTKALQSTQSLLVAEGYEVDTCDDGFKALQAASKMQYQLILLDLTLPNLNGFELLKRLRMNNKTPVMIMLARDDLFDKIYALEIGADDYITKPFNHRLLLARINAMSRRTKMVDNNSPSSSIEVNDISLCLSTRQVKCLNIILELTGYEFEILNFLVQNAGSIVSKDKIGEHVRGRAILYNDRSIDMHISNIRKKISTIVCDQKIKTIRGAGYIFLKETV